MQTTALNPTQMHLLKLFSFNNSEDYAREIQRVLTQHFQERLDAESDRLWEAGILSHERLEALRHEDLHVNISRMARLVLDTNSLIQCIARQSRFHELWLSFLDGRHTMCVSTEILEEYTEILEEKTSAAFAQLALDVITNNPYTEFITPWYHFNVITADPDDNKFVDCAVAANAHFIVTEDHHYKELEKLDFPKVDTIKLDDAMLLLI